jgi:hypothetical protein
MDYAEERKVFMRKALIIIMFLTASADLFAPGWTELPIGAGMAINPYIPVWKAVKWVELQGKPDTTINRDEWAYGPGQIRQAKLDDFNKARALRLRSVPEYTLQDCLHESVAREIFMWHCMQYNDTELAVKRWNGSGPRAEEYLKKVLLRLRSATGTGNQQSV